MLHSDIEKLLLDFRKERDWEKFHTVKNLSSAFSVETAELLSFFRWARDSDVQGVVDKNRDKIRNEIADIAILLFYICNDIGVSIEDAICEKIEINRINYPIEKSKGNFLKYSDL